MGGRRLLTVVFKAIVRFFLPTTSLVKYAVAALLLCPFGSMNVAIFVTPSEPRMVLTSLNTEEMDEYLAFKISVNDLRIELHPNFTKRCQALFTNLRTIGIPRMP